MKVFISSLIAGFEPMRAAARSAVVTLRHEPVMAEDFGAAPHSPQIACLNGLRSSDVVVLVLGDRYGTVQGTSGLSATHEEYREARGRKPVIAFVQEGGDPDAQQRAFITEVQGWEGGLFRGGFREPSELQAGVTRALHDYELATAVAPTDPEALVARATELLPRANGNGSSGTPRLHLSIVGGPLQKVLRPVQIEDASLEEWLHQAALFGEARVFDRAAGVRAGVDHAALVLEQERGARVQLDEEGAILLRLPVNQPRTRDGRGFGGLSFLIEETVQQRIATGLAFAGAILERIDPTQRLTRVAIAAQIEGAEHLGWRTQAEHNASPNSGTVSMGFGQDRPPVTVCQSRAALRLNTVPLIEDLLVPLRQQWKAR